MFRDLSFELSRHFRSSYSRFFLRRSERRLFFARSRFRSVAHLRLFGDAMVVSLFDLVLSPSHSPHRRTPPEQSRPTALLIGLFTQHGQADHQYASRRLFQCPVDRAIHSTTGQRYYMVGSAFQCPVDRAIHSTAPGRSDPLGAGRFNALLIGLFTQHDPQRHPQSHRVVSMPC